MPRQPYLKVVPNPMIGEVDFNINLARERPDLHAIVGDCLLAWPYVEAEMAVVLAELLQADNDAAIAAFQVIRRSASQRECISAAAAASRDERAVEIIGAVLNVTKSIESARNAFAHGHFGLSKALQDDLIWMDSVDYIKWRSYVSIKDGRWNKGVYRQMLSNAYIYRKRDISEALRDIDVLYGIWFMLIDYLQWERKYPTAAVALGYSQLCDQPHVAKELENIRRKNTPSASSQSPLLVDGAGI